MGGISSAMLSAVFGWLSTQLAHAMDWLWNLLSATWFMSPDMTRFPQIQHMTMLSRTIVNASLTLIVAVIGMLHLLSGGSEQSRYTVRTVGPRFVGAILAANLSTVIVSLSIRAANELTQALTGTDFTTQDTIAQLRAYLGSVPTHPDTLLVAMLLQSCTTIAMSALLITWMVRFGQLMIVSGVAPIALACHTFPVTQPVAAGWWRVLLGALITQILQATALTIAWRSLVDPQNSLPVMMGLPVDPGGTLNLAFVAFITAQVALIPRFVRRTLRTGSGGGSTLGGLFKMLVMQQVVGRLRVSRGRVAAPIGTTARNAIHYHTEGERQVTQLYGENAVQHSHVHERGSHQVTNIHEPGSHQNAHFHEAGSHQNAHVHERGSHQYTHFHQHNQPPATPPRPPWRPGRTGSPASVRLRRGRP